MSYQVLEQWAALGIGAAILPQSKLSLPTQSTCRITDRTGQTVCLDFEAIWNHDAEKVEHLQAFSDYLNTVVPAIAQGVISG